MKTELILKILLNRWKNKKSMSKFVEDLFNNSMGINQRIEEISSLVKELSGIIREQDLENMSYLEKNMSKKIFVDSDVILDILWNSKIRYLSGQEYLLSCTNGLIFFPLSL